MYVLQAMRQRPRSTERGLCNAERGIGNQWSYAVISKSNATTYKMLDMVVSSAQVIRVGSFLLRKELF